MRTNKILFLPLLVSFLALTGCATGTNNKRQKYVHLDEPENNDLEFWITDRVTSQDFDAKGCTYLPGWFGAEEYLDSRYEAVRKEEMDAAPEVHVTYLVTGYPDLKDDAAVTRIDITDPTIGIYGLTMTSSEKQIIDTMSPISTSMSQGETVDGGYYLSFQVENCVFTFRSDSIVISAPTTNVDNIIY